MIVIGAIPVVRFLLRYFAGNGDGNVQSLVLGGVFLLAGYLTVVLALISDTVATNRQLLERTLSRLRELEAKLDSDANNQQTRK